MNTTQEKATLALSYFTTGERISTDTGREQSDVYGTVETFLEALEL